MLRITSMMFFSMLAIAIALGGVQDAEARKSRKARIGWKRGKIRLHTLAKAFAAMKTLGSTLDERPAYPTKLTERFTQLRHQKPRKDYPWPARTHESKVGKHMVALYDLADERGWLRRSDLRRRLGDDSVEFFDFVLEQTNAGRDLEGLTHNALMARLPDKMMPAMISGQRLVPKMRGFDSAIRHNGKVRPDLEIDMRGQIVGNTAGLLLRGGSTPSKTRVYGKSYSFDARVGALLHSKGFKVEGTRFRDALEHMNELRHQQDKLYAHLEGLHRQGDATAKPLLEALKRYGGLETDDAWARVEKEEVARIEARILRQARSVKNPESVKKPLFMMVDDGADYLEVAARVLAKKEMKPYRHLFCAVEQTSKGHRLMEKVKPPFPVVSVAKAWAKNIYGNPMFGHAIARRARGLLDTLKKEQRLFIPSDSKVMDYPMGVMFNGNLPLQRAPGTLGERKTIRLGKSKKGHTEIVGGLALAKRAVIIGANGNIGKAVIRSLKSAGYEIGAYDKGGVESGRGMKVYKTLDAALKEGHLVISCTGSQTIGPAELDKLPDGAVVINGGSAGEFHLPRDPARNLVLHPQPESPLAALPEAQRRALYWAIRPVSDGQLKVPELEIKNRQYLRFQGNLIPVQGVDPHEVWVTKAGKEILVARGGGVINFPMDVSNPRAGKLVPGRFIDLEIGLLHLGMVQSQEGGEPGLHKLKQPPQEVLVKDVQTNLDRSGESLLAPDF